MTLSSRHRIWNSSPGGLRPSTLPLGHGGSPQYWLSHVDGEETFLFLSNRRDREPNPELVKGSGANHYPRAPARVTDHRSVKPKGSICLFVKGTDTTFWVCTAVHITGVGTILYQHFHCWSIVIPTTTVKYSANTAQFDLSQCRFSGNVAPPIGFDSGCHPTPPPPPPTVGLAINPFSAGIDFRRLTSEVDPRAERVTHL